MDQPQAVPQEERRFGQWPCKGAERRVRVHVYEMVLYDQETETPTEAQVNGAPS